MKKIILLPLFLFTLQFSFCQNEIPELPEVEWTDAGFNQDSIQRLIQLINERTSPDFRGMVVIKDGKLAIEEYFNTYWRISIHDIRSAGKSITALLMGIAIDKGLIKDVEQNVYDFFPKYKLNNPPTEKHLGIKIKHLLMMSSGLDADTDDSDSPGNVGNWVAGDDWVASVLNLPMAFESGERYVYNDACAMLTGAIVQEVSGKKLSDFAEEYLFDPLGIKEYYWYTGPKDITCGMGNLYISTLDFAKIGQLVLNKGNWQGEQLISEKWIEEISKKRIKITDGNPFSDHYGYLWYIHEVEINGKNYEYFFASGSGGNRLFIVPQENMVVGLTSSAYGGGQGRSNNIFEFILRSLEKK